MIGVESSEEVVQRMVSLWMMAIAPPCLLVRSRCVILYPSGVEVAMSGVEAGFSQVSVMKMMSVLGLRSCPRSRWRVCRESGH